VAVSSRESEGPTSYALRSCTTLSLGSISLVR
jgi:hypothetical protein